MVWVVSLLRTKLIPRTLTPELNRNGLRSLPEVGNLVGPLVQAVLYGRNAITRGYT
jgi:hypothetical protein